MSKKKKILIFIDWFLPGYKAGGPIRSVANIVDTLNSFFDFYIITSDRDLGDNISYSEIEFNKEIIRDNYKIRYLTADNQNIKTYGKLINKINPDKIYFNSLFSLKFTLFPLFAAKEKIYPENIIIAPRGMLGKGALNIKRNKKRVFLVFSKILRLFKGVKWHATTKDEASDIKNTFGKGININIAQNIPNKISKFIEKKKMEETRFAFVSRISEKKNILFAIKIFQYINSNKTIFFDIYGPVENNEYKLLCEKEKDKLPENIIVSYKGNIRHDKIQDVYKSAHFFILPSLHENYGHAIFEAFSFSCPVIISDQTPWRNLEEKNIGWDINLNNKEKFRKVIQKCIDMNQEEYDKMSENAFKFAKKFSENSEAVLQTKKLFE
ncbi:MAG: glycosyltransferase [Bacteroidales bacterium]|nr:glycosyltransferase [Bacteroidales bacterium]